MTKPGKIPDFRNIYPEASKEIIYLLKETERKMQYQEYDLKAERINSDQGNDRGTILPGREVSYERLLEEGFSIAGQVDVESIVLNKIEHEQLYLALEKLSANERYLIIQLFYWERSERDLAKELGVSQSAVNKRRQRVLDKLRSFLKKFDF